MVCAKCQKSQKRTELATPGVKRKNDLYFGSPAFNDKSKTSTTSGASGMGKVGCAASSALILVCSLTNNFYAEQTPQQRCQKSMRILQFHMCNMQDESTVRS